MKKTRNINNEMNNATPYPCMAPRGYNDACLSDSNFSLKFFIIKIILGIIGGIGIWYFNTSLEVAGSGTGMELSKIWPLVICVILLIIGIYGIFDLIQKILGLRT